MQAFSGICPLNKHVRCVAYPSSTSQLRNRPRQSLSSSQRSALTVNARAEPSCVTVHFVASDTYVLAAHGENIIDVARRCDVSIPTGCLSGSCGTCEVEVRKYYENSKEGPQEVLRACIGVVPEGIVKLEVDTIQDEVWGVDGWDL